MKRTLVLIALLVSFAAATQAAPRRPASTFAKYRSAATRDSVMADQSAPGAVLLDRDELRLTQIGDGVRGTVSREWVVLVRDPAGMRDYQAVRLQDFPGQRIVSMAAALLRGDEEKEIEPEKTSLNACAKNTSGSNWLLQFGDLEPGDILAVQCTFEIDGRNPYFTHRFERSIPVVQSDLTIEVPKNLMEGRPGRGFHWWAGPLAVPVAEQYWEKPASWRFRWGQASIAPLSAGASGRVVGTAWLFDPKAARNEAMADTDGQARFDDTNPAFHGPTLSANRLSGRYAPDRHEGRRDDSPAALSEASFGDLDWELAGAQFLVSLSAFIDDGKSVSRSLEAVAGTGSTKDIVERVSRHVYDRVALAEVPLAMALQSLHRPAETLAAPCASALDRTVLVCAVLRARGIDARPVLLKRDSLDIALTSIATFDAVGLAVSSAEGELYVDASSGGVASRVPNGPWSAALVTEVPGGANKPRLLLGQELTALN